MIGRGNEGSIMGEGGDEGVRGKDQGEEGQKVEDRSEAEVGKELLK
jgi:hypothetical protein